MHAADVMVDDGVPAVLEDAEPLPEPHVPERFGVTDEATANWVVRQIVESRVRQKRLTQQFDRELAYERHREQFFLMRFGRQLEGFARGELDRQQSRRKSLNLPDGTLGFRSLAERLVVDDERRALAWARQHCASAVVVVERLVRTPLTHHLEQTGELPDGSHVESAKEAFYVR